MKYQAVKHFLLIVIVFSLLPSFSEAEENVVLKRFSLDVKLGKDWKTTIDYKNQIVTFKDFRKESGPYRTILVREIDASKIYSSSHSERWVADAFRRGEEADMIARGVKKGMYKLKDLKKFELNVNGKNLYAMTYKQLIKRGLIGYGYLYLYFPDFENSNKFYIFLYSYVYRGSESRDVSLEEFYSVIKGFRLKRESTGSPR
jgi:uncharacterized lipoprotein YehR (DUF1307 family)